MRRLLLLLAACVCTFAGVSAAAPLPPAKMTFLASFQQEKFLTWYFVDIRESDRDYRLRQLKFEWKLTPPAQEPRCTMFAVQNPGMSKNVYSGERAYNSTASWLHGDQHRCNHVKMGPRGHAGVVTIKVTSPTWICQARYLGTVSGRVNALCVDR